MIIYPPLIADTIPAFFTEEIKIPFFWNPAVSTNEVTEFSLIIKDYSSSDIIATSQNTVFNENGYVTFNNGTNWERINPSSYYKFQLGWRDNTMIDGDGEPYYTYSTAAIGKCIGYQSPSLNIEVNDANPDQANQYNLVVESILGSKCENIYSYQFKVLDAQRRVLQNSDEILNKGNTAIFPLQIKYDDNIVNYIQFSIKTINGYEKSAEFDVEQIEGPVEECNKSIEIILDELAKNNGYVKIKVQTDASNIYFIERKKADNNYWETLIKIPKDTNRRTLEFKDCTLEQGCEYCYSIRTFDTKRKIFNTTTKKREKIKVDFEDMFLSDGERQLKICFDPKVSSFKEVVQEQKTDTIGGQFPFFFRNGNIKYKEIPIGGLISHLMDEQQMFMLNSELGLNNDNANTTSLTSENIYAERRFKLAVMEWLNDGKPKYFRSPTEGNYIIRLMNISLSPNETLGRMLHSFSATGYEIDENSMMKLLSRDLITVQDKDLSSSLGYFILGQSVLGGR